METRRPLRDVALSLIHESFSQSQAALLAGSVVRGEARPGSDIDLLIVDESATPHWETRDVEGWPVELFVFTRSALDAAFALDVRRRWPLHLTLCHEGEALVGEPTLVAELKSTAAHLLATGPAPLTPDEVRQKRYELTWLLDDLTDVAPAELHLIGHDVLLEAADMHLVFHQQWRGRGGKWTQRMLTLADAPMAAHFTQALTALHEQHDPQPALAFAQQILAEMGGRGFGGQYDAY